MFLAMLHHCQNQPKLKLNGKSDFWLKKSDFVTKWKSNFSTKFLVEQNEFVATVNDEKKVRPSRINEQNICQTEKVLIWRRVSIRETVKPYFVVQSKNALWVVSMMFPPRGLTWGKNSKAEVQFLKTFFMTCLKTPQNKQECIFWGYVLMIFPPRVLRHYGKTVKAQLQNVFLGMLLRIFPPRGLTFPWSVLRRHRKENKCTRAKLRGYLFGRAFRHLKQVFRWNGFNSMQNYTLAWIDCTWFDFRLNFVLVEIGVRVTVSGFWLPVGTLSGGYSCPAGILARRVLSSGGYAGIFVQLVFSPCGYFCPAGMVSTTVLTKRRLGTFFGTHAVENRDWFDWVLKKEKTDSTPWPSWRRPPVVNDVLLLPFEAWIWPDFSSWQNSWPQRSGNRQKRIRVGRDFCLYDLFRF